MIEHVKNGQQLQIVTPGTAERFAGDGLLTTYKKVVDISQQSKHYGLTKEDYQQVQQKLKNQKDFLRYSYLYDKILEKRMPLENIVISAYHNPDRYYAEIQNRVNTLVEEAKRRKLVPIFMTLTLPGEYHRMKQNRSGKLVLNENYNGVEPREAIKVLTKMFAKLRQDRSLKELSREERIYYRVNEPHKDGTPHTHILLYVPSDKVDRVVQAFRRIFDPKANDIQTDIQDASAYVMKYINKTLPLSKKEKLTENERYLNAWYSKHRIVRFNSSRTLAPLKLYRLLYRRFTLRALTKLHRNNELTIYVPIEDDGKIMEIFDGDELLYMRNENFILNRIGRMEREYLKAA